QLADYLYKIATYNAPKQITVIVNPTDTDTNSFSKEEKALVKNEHFPSLVDVFNSLKNEYLYEEEVDDNDLVLGAIEGMASRVKDKYTVFQRAEAGQTFMDSLSNEYEGIGIQFEMIDENFTVITPFRGSPAEEAGLLPNDIIKEVDGISILEMTQEEVVSKIKGSAGTKVKLTIFREGKTLYFTIERKKITYKTTNLTFEKSGDKNIAVVEILGFNIDTYQEFEAAADQIVEQKADGIILDLRNNPGGFVDVAVAMISLFTDREKTAVKMVDKNKNEQEYKTTKNGILKDYKGKTVILVNGGSASAAEIMAGALKDYGVATIMGEKTFGKGTVQTLKQYEDGSLFKYTIAKWFTPNGLDISEKSLMPSIIVKDSKMQMQKALEQFLK
ncbi:MAG: S41 family peptidase, partial [Candidatus Gracilibacteria bacterium]